MSIANDNDENMKERIKQQILQKRVDHIVKNSTAKMKVSECVPFASKKWVSPLTQFKQNESFESFDALKVKKKMVSEVEKDEVNKVVNVLDINKKLKYFGQFLKVQYESSLKGK